MSRRRLLGGLGLASLAWPLACGWPAPAQPPARVPRIGFLGQGGPSDNDFNGFRHGLHGLGYVEGQNITIEYRGADSDPNQLRELAAELVALPLEVLVAASVPQTQAAREATSTIPIVFVNHPDPVGVGHVASLARPGGNVTGPSFLGTPLTGKQLELLHDTVPALSRVAVLTRTGGTRPSTYTGGLDELRAAALVLGAQVQLLVVRETQDIDGALEAMIREQAQAILIMPGGQLFGTNSRRIAEFALQNHLPAMGNTRTFPLNGGLMAYGANADAVRQRSAYYVDRILKGAKPADLPVEQPTTFELVLNLDTARALGLTIPESVLLQVTEVVP